MVALLLKWRQKGIHAGTFQFRGLHRYYMLRTLPDYQIQLHGVLSVLKFTWSSSSGTPSSNNTQLREEHFSLDCPDHNMAFFYMNQPD